MPLLRDLIELPEHVTRGDFVMRLSEGVTRGQDTVADYVVTEQLALCFDAALTLVKTALQTRSSRGSYLHGSFGSGKSHFMAVLHLLLGGDLRARAKPELASTIAKHDEWMSGKKFLLVPYHLVGADNVESAVLGGYVAHIAKLHPESAPPAVYPSQELLANAETLRTAMGDAAFFGRLNTDNAAAGGGGWGKLRAGWDASSYDAAAGLWPDQPEHQRLIGDIVRHLLPAAEHAGRFIGIDNGLSAISRHAKGLGYDAVILFLDEMILWLASHAADIHFLNREVPKVAKLVEAANADRPAPLVSFIARQRDLRELVGQVITGAANLGFTDLLRFWEGRFGTINLEDRNLSAIAEKRLLRPRSEDARRQIDEAFTKSTQTREELVATLLTKKGSKDDFRRLYPFSPALVETLVAVSSVLQRERTAIRIMLELLVQRRDNLELGELVAVGDLYDLIAEGDEAFTAEMRSHFEQAHKLYRTQLRPLLEEQCGLSFEEASGRPWNDPDRRKLRNDDRLVKTLLLSALAPEVESLRALTPVRLAALNHGSIQSPIAGQEGQMVLRKVRDWAGRIGQVKIQEGGPTPVISLQLSAVDIDAILERADSENNHGSRKNRLAKALLSSLGAQSTGEFTEIHKFRWRGTDRTCEIRFVNVCEIGDDMFDNPGSDWKVLIDYPFDRTGRTVRDDLAKIEDYRSRRKDQARTLVWLPSFFGEQAQRDLGRLVCLEHVLSEHRFSGFVSHLTDIQRAEARTIMENQRSALNSKLAGWLRIAYGLDEQNGADVLDPGQILEGVEHFQSLRGEMVSRVPAGPGIDQALGQWLDQALTSQFPAHPLFDDSLSVARSKIQKVLDVCRRAAETSNGRAEVEGNDRALMRQLTGPLDLGVMHETAWVQSERWKLHFLQQEAMHGGPLDVGALRRAIDIPKPMGLPPIIQDLLILTFAAQTNRAIIRHHTPIPAEPGELRNEDLLRQETLPSPEIWERARSMAAEIFGIAQLPALPTAKAVSQFVAAVQTWLQERRASAALADLQSALIPHLANFGVEPENSARLITARDTASWLRGLDRADGCEFVELVAGAQFSSAPAAIARGLTTAASTAAALNGGHWAQEIEFARQLGGTASDEAAQIRQTVAGALRHDELVQSLAAVLNDSGKQARELIFKAATTGSQKPPPASPVAAPHRPSVDSIHVPVPDPTPARRTARSTSEVKGDALPAWLPREAARDLLKEVQLGEGGRRFAVTPLVARMLEMDPQASLSPDGLTLLLPKWDLHLPLEETNR
jgi:hypothetical protein